MNRCPICYKSLQQAVTIQVHCPVSFEYFDKNVLNDSEVIIDNVIKATPMGWFCSDHGSIRAIAHKTDYIDSIDLLIKFLQKRREKLKKGED